MKKLSLLLVLFCAPALASFAMQSNEANEGYYLVKPDCTKFPRIIVKARDLEPDEELGVLKILTQTNGFAGKTILIFKSSFYKCGEDMDVAHLEGKRLGRFVYKTLIQTLRSMK